MVENLRQTLSVRGLRRGGGPRTPLRHFKGVCESITPELDTRYENRLVVKFNFTDLEVIETKEPYDFPVGQIEIAKRADGEDTEGSRWGVFSLSAQNFLSDGQDLMDLDGKSWEMKWTPGHMLFDGRQNKEVEQEAWEIIGVEGATSGAVSVATKSAEEVALELLNGKTKEDFDRLATQNQTIMGDGGVMSLILDNKLIAGWEVSGKVKKNEDGTYTVV